MNIKYPSFPCLSEQLETVHHYLLYKSFDDSLIRLIALIHFPFTLTRMRPSTILQILKEITWRNATHHFKDGRRPEAEKLIHDHYKALKLEKRGVEKAEVT